MRKLIDSRKVSESRYKQCGVTPHFQRAKSIEKSIRKRLIMAKTIEKNIAKR